MSIPYDNALAETIIGLYKTELIRQRGPWRNIDDVEYATLEWVDWFNNRRLFQPIGDVPPAEFETAYYRQLEESAKGGLTHTKESPGYPGRFNYCAKEIIRFCNRWVGPLATAFVGERGTSTQYRESTC